MMRYVHKRKPFLYQRITEFGTVEQPTAEVLLDFERLPESQKLAVWVIDQSPCPGGVSEEYTVGGRRVLDTLVRKEWLEVSAYKDEWGLFHRSYWLTAPAYEAMQKHYKLAEAADGAYVNLDM